MLLKISKVKDEHIGGKDKMDILDLIKNEHRQIEALFSEIETVNDTAKLYKSFNQLSEEINLHTEVEAQTFYSAIRQWGKNELIDTAQREHNEVRRMLEEIESLSPTSEEFQAQVQALKQLFQHHIQEEENELFSQVRQYINEAKRTQMASEFASAKSKLASGMPAVG
ncbi:MAG: hemerythrin domain-containing protein [Chroococcidiopsidaceae cyanobacterium CP_BM_RX_35]|nr:hemerythrin domain-containing protein [Chroococcidiopsidaceae cyanobacterium CP_BM_RX_35]